MKERREGKNGNRRRIQYISSISVFWFLLFLTDVSIGYWWEKKPMFSVMTGQKGLSIPKHESNFYKHLA